MSKYRCALLGGAVDQRDLAELVRTDPSPPFQANKHQWSIIEGIEAASGEIVTIISSVLLSDFPRNRRLVDMGGRWAHRSGARDVKVPFVNLVVLKHITRFVSSLVALIRWVMSVPSDYTPIVVVHGSISAHMYAAMSLRLICQRSVLVQVVTDPPSRSMAGDGPIRRALRICDRALIRHAMRKMDGLVVLNQNIVSGITPKVRSLFMEGILSTADAEAARSSTVTLDENRHTGPLRIAFCGSISAENGIYMLLEAISYFQSCPIVLEIYGKGPAESDVKAAAKRDVRIVYRGYVEAAELAAALRRQDVLVNLRPDRYLSNHYSFPSKVMELLATGVPVLSTRCGMPGDYAPFLTYLEEDTPLGLARAIEAVASEAVETRNARAANARLYVLEVKSVQRQGQRLDRFLGEIAEVRGHDIASGDRSPAEHAQS